MDDDLIAAHRDLPKLMPYLHLPVQSGSDRMLAAMNRRHTARRLSAPDRAHPRGAARHRAVVRLHRRLPRRDAMPISRRRCGWSREVGFARPSRSNTARGPARRRPTIADQVPEPVKAERLRAAAGAARRAAAGLQPRDASGGRSTCCSSSRAAIPARSSASRPICRPVQVDATGALIGDDRRRCGSTRRTPNSLFGDGSVRRSGAECMPSRIAASRQRERVASATPSAIAIAARRRDRRDRRSPSTTTGSPASLRRVRPEPRPLERRLGVDADRPRQPGHAAAARRRPPSRRAACSKSSTTGCRQGAAHRRSATSTARSEESALQGTLFPPPSGAAGRACGFDQIATRKRGPVARAQRRRRTPTSARCDQNELVFGVGPAGTGKTYLAVGHAVVAARAGRRSSGSSCRARRSRPASGSASCPATCARRSIPTCARSTTR